jgi:2-polyprenyl-3-methyl-5-hydroxy-6-metoxy-1,4-benzoquinol methylase
MLKEYIKNLYETDFSNHDYDKYYFGLRYLGNRHLLSKLEDLNLKGKRILDIGSGRLILSTFLSRFGSSVVAFDLPKTFEEYYVKKRAKSLNIDLVGSRIEKGNTFRLPFKGSTFDIVMMTEVIEHLNFSPNFIANEIRRVLKDEGHFILTTPNVHCIENKLKFLLNKNIYGDCDRYLQSSPFDYHWREFEKKELVYILQNSDFKVINSYFCNDILYNKYNSYLYKNFSQKARAYLKKLIYFISFPFPGLKKQIVLISKQEKINGLNENLH